MRNQTMKKGLGFVLVAAMVSGLVAGCGNKADAVEVPEIEGYELLWHDEFTGDKLDETNWNVEVRDPGWTNHELQAYMDDEKNVYVEDGKLVLRAVETPMSNGRNYYSSGKVNSQHKKPFTYGKVVVSAKVPEGQGLWPAIWMMPENEMLYGQWPKCGEIDIMEVLGHNVDTAYSTIHYGEPHAQQQGLRDIADGEANYAEAFHEYSVEWEPGEIRWYIDGEMVLTVNDWFSAAGEEEQEYPAPFNQPFFVQMNLAVGGDWPGDPDENTDFENAKFEIDYVRVYQKAQYDMNVTKPVYEPRVADETGNFIVDGDFSDASEDLTDDVDWKFLLAESGQGSACIQDGAIEILTEAQGTVDYSVQLVHWDIPLEKGKKYRVTYDAKAEENRNIIMCVSAPYADWIRYFPDPEYKLTTEWQTFTEEFVMENKSDPRGRLEFNLGNRGSCAKVWITNVRVEEITE